MTKDKYCTFCGKELVGMYVKDFWNSAFCSRECIAKWQEQIEEQVRNKKGDK
ncbi:hypothetical protein [Metamycoplasma hominis]|uniref:TRASH domain-containing protein n=1 Tax=Metamycoplasma hominis TaxID=2098 RepID=A0A6A8PZT4_METHO|nr:hypothetical protein [Metamycoplasma hominis]MTH76008.1 hypothetical protein [Metamycoplasma hominis]